jgi:molecular chaperone GrpE
MAGDDAEKDAAVKNADIDGQQESADAADQQGAEPGNTGQTAAEADNDIEALIAEAVAAALAEQQDSVLRAQAEVQNMRRRCEADVEKAHKFALEKFSAELLTVIDNLERALDAVPDSAGESVNALREGVELTLKGFLETCEKFNIRQLNPEGEPFDPQMHQAMSMVPNPDVEPNTVVAVVQKGYLLNDRVIRPAMVMVSKAG